MTFLTPRMLPLSMSGLFMAFLELHCKLYKTVIIIIIIYPQQSALEREAKAIRAQKYSPMLFLRLKKNP